VKLLRLLALALILASRAFGAIEVSSVATAGDGLSVSSAWTGWDTALIWTGQEYHFKGGFFKCENFPNWMVENIALIGESNTFLIHTGSGDAVRFDNPTSWTWRVRMEHFKILGNANTRHGLFVRGARFGIFRDILVSDVTNTAFVFEACVSNSLENLGVSDPTPPLRPAHALWVGSRSTNAVDGSTGMIFTNFIGEKTTGDYTAVIKAGSDGNSFIGGTIEENAGKGLIVESSQNKIGLWFEKNLGWDLELQNSRNTVEGITSQNEVHISGAQNAVLRSKLAKVYVHPYANMNIFEGVEWTSTFDDQNNQGSTIKIGNIAPTNAGWLQWSAKFPNVNVNMWALQHGTTVNTNCIAASNFDLVAYENFLLANPTGAINGQRVTWRIKQGNAGGWIITYGSKFRVKTGGTFPVLSTPGNSVDYLVAIYNSSRDTWDIQ